MSSLIVASLTLVGCGAPGTASIDPSGASRLPTDALSGPPIDIPVVGRADRIAVVKAAVAASFDRPSGKIIRRTSTGSGGIEVELVSYLDWDGESGRSSQEMVVDDRYMSNPQVSELVASNNRELAAGNRDLLDDGLREALAKAERGVLELLDGITPEPVGLGWWEGTTGGDLDPQRLWLVIIDGRLRSITRRADVVGSAVTDEWKFVE